MTTIISISGYGATGSSAVVDLLKGNEAIEVLDDFEFQIHYFPYCISDLDYKLNESCSRFYDSDLAIKKFLEVCQKLDEWYKPAFNGQLHEMAEDYIKQLNPITWDGYWAYDRLMTSDEHKLLIDLKNKKIDKRNSIIHFINRILRKLHLPLFDDKRPHLSYFTERKMYMCLKPDNFIDATQQFSARLIKMATHKNKEIIAINQLLPPQDPVRYEKYFPYNIKSIIVSRDPRDLWMHYHILKKSFHSPRKNVNEFIKWYRENMKENVNVKAPNILRIAFEDIIYDYDNSKQKICKFIGIDNVNINMQYFNPHKSAVNTQLYKKNLECKQEIEQITKELPEFLYNYENVKNVVEYSNTNVF